jgi:hypothetical protein
VRLSAAGERTIRWPRIAFWTWQPPDGGAGLLLFRSVEPQQRWRTYATLLLDVAARCGVQRLVSLGAVLEAVPNSVRLNFCIAVELSDASGQYERSIPFPWPIH